MTVRGRNQEFVVSAALPAQPSHDPRANSSSPRTAAARGAASARLPRALAAIAGFIDDAKMTAKVTALYVLLGLVAASVTADLLADEPAMRTVEFAPRIDPGTLNRLVSVVMTVARLMQP